MAHCTAQEVQQNFAESFAVGQKIVFDYLKADQANILKDKIKSLIPNDEDDSKGVDKQIIRETLFESVWAQRKYTNNNLVSTIIYILVTKETDVSKALHSTEFSCHPVFRTRKCFRLNGDTSGCCMIFIDEFGRVYQNWSQYLKNNMLPEGTMVAPKNGIYTLNMNNEVELSFYKTPNSYISKKIKKVANRTVASLGIASMGVPVAALCIPVAASVMTVASGVAVGSAVYSATVAGSQLLERRKHEQSICLTNKDARNSWLSLAAGIVFVGASASTSVLSQAAANGRKMSMATRVAVNGMNFSSIVISGTGVFNGALDFFLKYRDDEKITVLDVAQLSASLLLFTHSIYNFKLATKIVVESRIGTIESYRQSLRNTLRKIFEKLSSQTNNIFGDSYGNIDIIRIFNEIPSSQDLDRMFQMSTVIDAIQNVAVTYSLNNLKFTDAVLYYFSKKLNRPVELKLPNAVSDNINNEDSFKDILAAIMKNLGEEGMTLILNVLAYFCGAPLHNLERKIQLAIPSEIVLHRILLHCLDVLKSSLPNRELLTSYLKNDWKNISTRVQEYFETYNPRSEAAIITCSICTGYFAECAEISKL